MVKGSDLYYMLICILIGTFVLCYTYKHLKMGKAWSPRSPKLYSFTRETKEAYSTVLWNCIFGTFSIIAGIWFSLAYFHISWNFKSNLFIGLITSALGIFTFYHTYKYLKRGEASFYGYKIHSFKKQSKEAYLILLISCFTGVLSIFVGILFLFVNK